MRDNDGNIESEMYHSIHLVLDNIIKNKDNVDKEVEKFAKFLKGENLEELEGIFKGDEKYMACLRTVEDLTTDPDLIGYYDYEEAKKQELIDAKELAMEQGYEEGIEQGKKEGVKEANIEIAKNLLKLDISMDKISKATKLTLDEIKALKNLRKL